MSERKQNKKIDKRAPVIVGVGDLVDRSKEDGLNPQELLAEACEHAIQDSGIKELSKHIDYVGVVRFTVDFLTATNQSNFQYSNFPRTLANKLNISAKNEVYAPMGGNSPQVLLEDALVKISTGETDCALLSGGEALQTMIAKLKAGMSLDWLDEPGGSPEMIGNNDIGFSDHEKLHGMDLPTNVYPLFAQALRKEEKKTAATHLDECSALFSEFSKIASKNPYSWFPSYRSATEIAEETTNNRMVGFPYTKYLNSVIRVNMASAFILMSQGKADELNVAENKRVYVHGCSILNDIWNVTERPDFHSSPAIKTCVNQSLDQADISLSDIKHFDLYSCFPSAVQIAKKELGIPEEKKDLTVTGGLPYFGGPGNSYTMFSTTEMVRKLRKKPQTYGLLTANSWFITKHAALVMSTIPAKPFKKINNSSVQKDINSKAIQNFTETPSGNGKIDTYTVINGRKGLEFALIIGTLDDGTRFIANSEKDEILLNKMIKNEMLDAKVSVSQKEGKNIFNLI
ncbi:acetyl-CoA acetyltransferase [Gammaproteobacteria bacterium]|nr:acetyl-CoA acetyltransferase [Gammaproteobacteria bacterium]